jgi:hypothetical protein
MTTCRLRRFPRKMLKIGKSRRRRNSQPLRISASPRPLRRPDVSPHFNPVQRIRQALGHRDERPLQISSPTFVQGAAFNTPSARVIALRPLPPLPQPSARGLYSTEVIAWFRKEGRGERCSPRPTDCWLVDFNFLNSGGQSRILLITTRDAWGKTQIDKVGVNTKSYTDRGKTIATYTRFELGCAAQQLERWLAERFKGNNRPAPALASPSAGGARPNHAAIERIGAASVRAAQGQDHRKGFDPLFRRSASLLAQVLALKSNMSFDISLLSEIPYTLPTRNPRRPARLRQERRAQGKGGHACPKAFLTTTSYPQ